MTELEDIPAEWWSIALQPKTIFNWLEWSNVQHPPSKAPLPRRDELNTFSGETTVLVRQLSDEQHVSIIGARLRIEAFAYRREHDVTATLEVAGGRNGVTIARVDAWPTAPHGNYKARKQKALRHLSWKGTMSTAFPTMRSWVKQRSPHPKTCRPPLPLTRG